MEKKIIICKHCKKRIINCRCSCPDVMEKEFNLSEKVIEMEPQDFDMVYLKDVKEFIRRVKVGMCCKWREELINKIAGEKFK